MLALGMGARLLVLGLLVIAGFLHLGWIAWLVLVGFRTDPVRLAAACRRRQFSGGTLRAPTARGESVGLFNAATSLAAAVGSQWQASSSMPRASPDLLRSLA